MLNLFLRCYKLLPPPLKSPFLVFYLHSFQFIHFSRRSDTFTFSKFHFLFIIQHHLYFFTKLKMKFSIPTALLALISCASAIALDSTPVRRELLERQGANANRPVPTGACCVAATSLKEDVCFNNGQSGRCIPASVNNCKIFPAEM